MLADSGAHRATHRRADDGAVIGGLGQRGGEQGGERREPLCGRLVEHGPHGLERDLSVPEHPHRENVKRLKLLGEHQWALGEGRRSSGTTNGAPLDPVNTSGRR